MDKILEKTKYLCKNCMEWKPLTEMATNTICKKCRSGETPKPRRTSKKALLRGF
jgi:hypothetical protein